MIIFIVSFFSFVLEYVFNCFFHNSVFLPLVILTSLVLLRPYFKSSKSYFIYCFLIGFLYDSIYTGNYFMNAGLFLIIGVLVSFISLNMPNNLFVSILEILVLVSLYRIFSFLFFFFNGVVSFSFKTIFESIYSSLILNIGYGIVLYFILYFVSKKFNIKRIN